MLGLYRAKPDDGVVVGLDERGPIQLIPHQGSGWAGEKRCERLCATYNRRNGVRYLFGAYDVHADRLHGRLQRPQERRRGARLLPADPDALQPAGCACYLIADNLSTHTTPTIREWADGANTELVFTPTYASSSSTGSSATSGIGEFVINNADYPSWDALAKAMADHIRYRT